MLYACINSKLASDLSVQTITFEVVDIEASFMVWWCILTISRSRLSIKVIGSMSHGGNANFVTWTSGFT